MCDHHFHPSILQHNEYEKCALKLGATNAVFLTIFSTSNGRVKDNHLLSWKVGLSKDIQCIHEHEFAYH